MVPIGKPIGIHHPPRVKEGDFYSVVSLDPNEKGPPLEVRSLPPNPKYIRNYVVRNSRRWMVGHDVKDKHELQYIDKLGRFTGHVMFTWQCDPRQYIATVIATVAQRLVRYCSKHNDWRVVRRRLRDILRCAAYYSLTRNGWYWDRILFFSRNLEKFRMPMANLTTRMVKRMDEPKRFVYGQASSQANWLLFRVRAPRDKSIFWKEGRSWRSDNGSPVPARWLEGVPWIVAQTMTWLTPRQIRGPALLSCKGK